MRRWHRHPDWKPEVSPALHDIAVIVLDEPCPFEPLAVADLRPTPGMDVRIVGYGVSAVSDDEPWPRPIAETGGRRRTAVVRVHDVADGFFSLHEQKTNVAEGDSGGPVLHQTAGGEVVIGVVSTSSRDYMASHHVPVAAHLRWLLEVAGDDLAVAPKNTAPAVGPHLSPCEQLVVHTDHLP